MWSKNWRIVSNLSFSISKLSEELYREDLPLFSAGSSSAINCSSAFFFISLFSFLSISLLFIDGLLNFIFILSKADGFLPGGFELLVAI